MFASYHKIMKKKSLESLISRFQFWKYAFDSIQTATKKNENKNFFQRVEGMEIIINYCVKKID